MASILAGCWNPLQPLGHFAWHWACQCNDISAFILLCSLSIFFFLDLVSGNLALTAWRFWPLTWTSNFHCFGALGVGPGGWNGSHVTAWSMGMILAIVEPQSKSHKKAWPLLFLEFSKILENNGTQWGVSNLTPMLADSISNVVVLWTVVWCFGRDFDMLRGSWSNKKCNHVEVNNFSSTKVNPSVTVLYFQEQCSV